jgi:hypothetical protein
MDITLQFQIDLLHLHLAGLSDYILCEIPDRLPESKEENKIVFIFLFCVSWGLKYEEVDF